MLGELHREAPERGPVQSGEEAFDDPPGHQLQAAQLGHFVWVEKIEPTRHRLSMDSSSSGLIFLFRMPPSIRLMVFANTTLRRPHEGTSRVDRPRGGWP